MLPALALALVGVLPLSGKAAQANVTAPSSRLQQLATGVVAPTATAVPIASPVAESLPPAHYVVVIVVDGNKASYYDLAQLPHIQALMNRGVVYDQAWTGEMESSTPNVHVTLGTGTLPRENGFDGFGWAAPQTRVTVDFRSLLADGQIDPVLQALPTPSIATRLHELYPNAVSLAASGHKDYAVVGLGGGAATYELYGQFSKNTIIPSFLPGHSPPPLTPAQRTRLTWKAPLAIGSEDAWAVQYALAVARQTHPHLFMINLPETDTWGHWYGPSHTQVFRRLMLGVDSAVGKIENTYRQMGILDQTDFIITADHGMMESLPAHNWHDLWVAAAAAHARVVRADGEGGSVWLANPAQAKQTAQKLVAMRPLHVEAIFYRSALGADYHYVLASPLGWLVNTNVATALQTLVDTTAGRNGPDLWVLYRENYTVVPRNVSGVWKGTHGGATWKVQHIPMILAGPGIASHAHSQFPARIVDLTPTIEYLLGLPPLHRDGVLLADALTDAKHGEIVAQSTVAPQLRTDVAALQAQSAIDDRPQPHWPAARPPIFRCTVSGVPGSTKVPGCTIKPAAPTNQ